MTSVIPALKSLKKIMSLRSAWAILDSVPNQSIKSIKKGFFFLISKKKKKEEEEKERRQGLGLGCSSVVTFSSNTTRTKRFQRGQQGEAGKQFSWQSACLAFIKPLFQPHTTLA